MSRTVVTLDPDYIPWEPENKQNVVKLRRIRTKGQKAMAWVMSLLIPALFIGGLFWYMNNRDTFSQSDAVASSGAVVATATAAITESVANVAVATTAPDSLVELLDCEGQPTVGQMGKLFLWGTDGDNLFTCRRYVVFMGAEILATGRTDTHGCSTLSGDIYNTRGGVVDVSQYRRKDLTIECDE